MRLLQRNGQTVAWEAIIIMILIVSMGVLIYLLFKKDSSPQIYQSGSKPKVLDIAPHPSFFGCVRVDVADQWGKNESIVNKNSG